MSRLCSQYGFTHLTREQDFRLIHVDVRIRFGGETNDFQFLTFIERLNAKHHTVLKTERVAMAIRVARDLPKSHIFGIAHAKLALKILGNLRHAELRARRNANYRLGAILAGYNPL